MTLEEKKQIMFGSFIAFLVVLAQFGKDKWSMWYG